MAKAAESDWLNEDRPFTDEERKYLHEWSLDWKIQENERRFAQSKKHDKGEHITVDDVLAKSGVEIPPPPVDPIPVGVNALQYVGPAVVEGENDVPPAPGEATVRVPMPRDHPLTGVVDDENSTAATSSGDDEDEDDPQQAEINQLTVEELQDNLRELGKPVSGNKKELQERLKEALDEANAEA